ncbi:MAG: PDDEXK nuclease domain-containing protein [Deltaproteobacteria bacterium]
MATRKKTDTKRPTRKTSTKARKPKPSKSDAKVTKPKKRSASASSPTAKKKGPGPAADDYGAVLEELVEIVDTARRMAVRSVNAVMTAAYWQIGRRLVEHEQSGSRRAEYGQALVERVSAELTARFGRGFGKSNLFQMRAFYLAYRSMFQTVSGISSVVDPGSAADRFPLSWSAYVTLLRVENEAARRFYEEEALRGGWSVRQLDRQIGSQFYERTLLSRNKAAMLRKGSKPKAEDAVSIQEETRDPYVLEFLDLKDEYSETDLEEALIRHLESFLLELGGDFTFVGRQKRLRIGDNWFRVDLVFFHRGLRCLVLIDLKLGRLTHADVGQMHTYCNYARRHWIRDGENPPVGLILCADENRALAEYALEGLPNKVLAARYRTELPDTKMLEQELSRTKRRLERG